MSISKIQKKFSLQIALSARAEGTADEALSVG